MKKQLIYAALVIGMIAMLIHDAAPLFMEAIYAGDIPFWAFYFAIFGTPWHGLNVFRILVMPIPSIQWDEDGRVVAVQYFKN